MTDNEIQELAFTIADTCRMTGVSVADTIAALACAIGIVVGTQPRNPKATESDVENHILRIIRAQIEGLKSFNKSKNKKMS